MSARQNDSTGIREQNFYMLSPLTAQRLARNLRRRGYQATVKGQWVTAKVDILKDTDAVAVLRRYGAINWGRP